MGEKRGATRSRERQFLLGEKDASLEVLQTKRGKKGNGAHFHIHVRKEKKKRTEGKIKRPIIRDLVGKKGFPQANDGRRKKRKRSSKHRDAGRKKKRERGKSFVSRTQIAPFMRKEKGERVRRRSFLQRKREGGRVARGRLLVLGDDTKRNV